MILNLRNCVIGSSVISLIFLATGCGKKEEAATTAASTAVTVSGQLTSVSKTSARISDDHFGLGRSQALALADLTVKCFAGTEAISATVSSDGKFSVAMPSGKNQRISCSFFDTAGALVGDMIFSNASSTAKTLGGGSQSDDSISISTNADLATFKLDGDGGEALVDTSHLATVLANSEVAAASAFNFTGKWEITEVPAADVTAAETALKFKTTLCSNDQQNNDCNGPPKNQVIYMHRVVGKNATGKDAYGMLLWQDYDSFVGCGSVLGQTYAKLKTDTGIDFTSSGTAEGDFQYSTSVNVTVNGSASTATVTDGWKLSTAVSFWEMRDCGPVAVGTENGWKCTDTAGKTQTSLGGGCKLTSTGKAVQITDSSDWQAINSCTQTGPDANGFYTNTCTGTSSKGAVSCEHKYKQDAGFNWQNVATVVAQNAPCSTISETTTRLRLAKLQCYANAYWQQSPKGACMKRIRTNWSTEDPDKFIDTARVEPNGLVFADVFKYEPSGLAGGMMTRTVDYQGVRVQNSSGQENWVQCKTKEVGAINVKKVTDSKLRATYVSTTTLAEPLGVKPACDAKYGTIAGAVDKFLFYLVKK